VNRHWTKRIVVLILFSQFCPDVFGMSESLLLEEKLIELNMSFESQMKEEPTVFRIVENTTLPLEQRKFKRKAPIQVEEQLGNVVSPSCKKIIVKNGTNIVIKLSGKPVKTHDSSFSNILGEFVDTESILIESGGDEWRSYDLINCSSGNLVSLNYIPVWSPSMNRFLVIGWNIENSRDNTAQVWKVEGGKFIKEWEPNSGGTNEEWISDTQFRFTVVEDEPGNFKYDCRLIEKNWSCTKTP